MRHKFLFQIIIIALMLSACGKQGQSPAEIQITAPAQESTILESPEIKAEPINNAPLEPEINKPVIVSTVFPQYDWVRQILGDNSADFELVILGNRIDLHNYQPSVDDIITISTCDLFIYVGGESDGWVDGVLANSHNPDMVTINLLSLLDTAEFEDFIKIRPEPERQNADSSGDGHHHHHHDEVNDEELHDDEIDEHIWLSLYNAAFLTGQLANAIILLDPDNQEIYEENMAAFISQLFALNDRYHEVVDDAATHTILCADRFPFHYLASDYGIAYYAAFPGCSAETEASFEMIIFLAEKIDELGLRHIIVTEDCDLSIARTVINNTASKDQTIHILDSMQSVSAIGALQTTYLEIMESNLNVLKDILR
ncbi:MAG: metal ABC transporter substrate-binding protein [Lachnospiraceae bacterium]|nr:metal ABC transporter substrate-binding protein [Lachnospiraceae bacterium]